MRPIITPVHFVLLPVSLVCVHSRLVAEYAFAEFHMDFCAAFRKFVCARAPRSTQLQRSLVLFVLCRLLRMACCAWLVAGSLSRVACCGWLVAGGLLRVACCAWLVAGGLSRVQLGAVWTSAAALSSRGRKAGSGSARQLVAWEVCGNLLVKAS